jgi:hypothetical protein
MIKIRSSSTYTPKEMKNCEEFCYDMGWKTLVIKYGNG